MYFRSKSNINILMLIRIIGWLLLIESAFMIIPLITSLIYKEDDYISFIISIIAIIVGMVIMYSIKATSNSL